MLMRKKLKTLFVYTNCMLDNLIPVGISSVLGALKNSGMDMEIKLFDTTFYKTNDISNDEDRKETLQVKPFDYSAYGVRLKKENVFSDFRKLVEGFKPDVLMISIVEVTYPQGTALLESIKDIRPYVVAGGGFPILASNEVIQNPLIDAVCIGEGEDAMPEFCDKFQKGEDFTKVSGIWFKKKDGSIIKNPIKKLVDLEKAAFLDFSLYEKGRFYKPMQGKIFRMVPLEFSRGCPYRCSYCANHALEMHFKSTGKWYRWKSMDRIFAEIDEYVEKYKVEFFYFVSETFLSMLDKKFDEFCERYSS